MQCSRSVVSSPMTTPAVGSPGFYLQVLSGEPDRAEGVENGANARSSGPFRYTLPIRRTPSASLTRPETTHHG